MDHSDPIHSDEEALVRAAGGGDADAFERLVAPLARPLYGYAVKLTGDPDLAEDLVQDSLIKAFRGIGSFTGNSALATWLHRILRNTWIDHMRRTGREVLLDDRPGADGEPPEEPPALARQAVERYHQRMRADDIGERLERALAELSADLREVVILRDVQGYRYDEIAAITEVAEGTVKSRLARARERLRELLTASDRAAPRPPTRQDAVAGAGREVRR